MKTKILFVVLIAALLVLLGAVPVLAQDTTYTLTISAGDGQHAEVMKPYDSLQVTVTDAGGAPVSGVGVTFTAPPFGPSVSVTQWPTYAKTTTVVTDDSGIASVHPTAGCIPGEVQVTAHVGDQSVIFNLTNYGATPPYCLDNSWTADPLMPGMPPPAPDTPIDTAVEGWWWRDTLNQNALLQHSRDVGLDTLQNLYSDSSFKVYVYISPNGTNITILTTSRYYFLIGCGGGSEEAEYARHKLSNYIYGKTLKGVVLRSTSPEDLWGCRIWTKSSPAIPVYASSGFDDSVQKQFLVYDEFTERNQKFWGTFLPWSADGFLGSGIMKEYRADMPQLLQNPSVKIYESTNITLEGNVIRLIPTGASTDGLMVYLPEKGILDMGEFHGWQLPDAGLLTNPGLTIQSLIDSLDFARSLAPNTLILKTGMPIREPAESLSYLQIQRDALQYIRDQTINKINQHYTLDEVVATVKLPDSLSSSRYLKEYASDVPSIVRAVWTEHLGWWGGNTTELANTLTEDVKAQVLADAYGSEEALIAAARQAELNALDLAGAEKALYLADAAYRVAPDNFEAKQIYAQALRKLAFLQTSAYRRNYFISVANSLGTEQQVSDIYKTGVEDTPLDFTSAEFSQHFSGIGGALLSTVKIVSLPENGALTLAGADVVAGQELPVEQVDGLVFTPPANWNGSTSFLWNGKDGTGYATMDASVRITIDPVNDAPFVSSTPLGDLWDYEGILDHVLVPLASGFEDVDGDELVYTVECSEPPGVLQPSVNGSDLALVFLPNWWGMATFTVTATDPAGESAKDEFTFTIHPVNDAPTAADASITVVAGKSQTITLNYGDLETAQANLTVTFGELNGTLDRSALPSLTYTAPATAGDDSFTFTVKDRGEPENCTGDPPGCSAPQSATATVHVTVLPAPSASISGVIFNDANANGSLDAGEGGLAGVVVQLQDASGSELETFTTDADGAYTFTSLDAGSYQVHAPLEADRVQTTQNPIAVTLDEAQAATSVNIGSVVSADLKVSMTYGVNSKKIIYAITVTNDGPADALIATLTDILPNTVAYISVISTQGTCSGGKTVNCDFGTIAPGGSITVTIQVNRINTKIPVVNTATVSSNVFDIEAGDNSAEVTIP